MKTVTKHICNVCGEEYDYKKDAVYCHPDIVEVKKPCYKTRAGTYKEIPRKDEPKTAFA